MHMRFTNTEKMVVKEGATLRITGKHGCVMRTRMFAAPNLLGSSTWVQVIKIPIPPMQVSSVVQMDTCFFTLHPKRNSMDHRLLQ